MNHKAQGARDDFGFRKIDDRFRGRSSSCIIDFFVIHIVIVSWCQLNRKQMYLSFGKNLQPPLRMVEGVGSSIILKQRREAKIYYRPAQDEIKQF